MQDSGARRALSRTRGHCGEPGHTCRIFDRYRPASCFFHQSPSHRHGADEPTQRETLTVNMSTWQKVLGAAGVLLLIGWLVTGHLITGIAALVLLLAMAGGALLFRFQGSPGGLS